jgi:hypothetical protein
MKMISTKNWLYLGGVFFVSAVLSAVVKYALPLFITMPSKPLLWLAILFPAAAMTLILLNSKDFPT